MDFNDFTIFLNNKITAGQELQDIFLAIQENAVVSEKGGYLFKSAIDKNRFHIGILPFFIEGQRSYHYNIKLAYEDEYAFAGFFNADGTIGLLFHSPREKESINWEYRIALRDRYINTAGILIHCGFSAQTPLDWISRKMVEEIRISKDIPTDLGQLFSLDSAFPLQ